MKSIELKQEWKMRIAGEEEFYPAEVPGSVYQTLLNAGRIEDPYYRDNEDAALGVMKQDFEYHGVFDLTGEDLSDADEIILRFNGLDTIAKIVLNRNVLGEVNNMHRTWDYSVKELLREKGNELVITFRSPVEYIARQYALDPAILGTEDAMRGFPKIRKAHYMFGWDWGPRLPDAGIWKPVELLKAEKAELRSVYVHEEWNDDYSKVALSVRTKIRKAGAGQPEITPGGLEDEFRIIVTIISPSGEVLYDKACQQEFRIEDPLLWWPNGLGDQPLYQVIVELAAKDGHVYDSWSKRIGLRYLTISTKKDEYGAEFAHVVNGVKFFAMGADYIPEDNLLYRTGPERTRVLLEQCVAANFNCIRVWGGGLYPDDSFFDICDELGLVVWQDFMFACANYRLTREFEENILAELKDQIRRLRHHACLGLWCGNNEMEMFVDKGEWGAKNEIKSDYVKMYEYLFPRLLEEEDPDRFYWPASPSTGGGFDSPNDPDRGDVHYWEVWHGNMPFTEYRKFYFRYLSEFGFQSFPSIRTVESFTLPEDRNVFSYVMEKHQRNASANGKIMNYMEQTFLYPNDLDTLIYASQLLQAEAIRYGVEHFRRNRGRCMGTVYWQLNDCWPVASWSSIDYYGRWKALHYYARRFFAPLMLSCEEEGLISQTMNVNAEPFEIKKSVRFNVANESREKRRTQVCWQLRTAEGAILTQSKEEVVVEALSSVWCERIELPEADVYSNYVSYQLLEEGNPVSEGSVLFCQPKHFRFVDPRLKVRAEGDEIIVTAEHYAKGIEVRNEKDNLILSDNFFDLNGGEKRVRLIRGETKGLEVRSVYQIR